SSSGSPTEQEVLPSERSENPRSERAGSCGSTSGLPATLPSSHLISKVSESTIMAVPQLLNDIVNVLLLLAPSAALLCLLLASISLRREGGGISFVIGGGFTTWMFWAVVFLTLEP